MKIVSAKLGTEGNIEVELTAGNLTVTATEDTLGCKINVTATVPLTYLVDAGAAKANSPLLSAIAGVLDGALKQIA